jgi:maleylpyruvate isomerase
MKDVIRLHNYWRSSASYRVRLALNFKKVPYDQVTYDLRKNAHKSDTYRMLAPQSLVPALETKEQVIAQSAAILEWLEETHPEPSLLPSKPEQRAIVRSICALIGCDVHPLHNLRVLEALRRDFGASDHQVRAWIGKWILDGFAALETIIAKAGGDYAFGNSPTFADCYLLPQHYVADRFKVDLSAFPNINRVVSIVAMHQEAVLAHPRWQPDADTE